MNNREVLTNHNTFHNSTGKQTHTDDSGICLSEGIYFLLRKPRKMENKSTKRSRMEESVCLLPKPKKGRRKENRMCSSKLHKVRLSLGKLKRNSSTPCALYMLIEGLLQTAGSPSNVL